jgi:hypothetical protein
LKKHASELHGWDSFISEICAWNKPVHVTPRLNLLHHSIDTNIDTGFRRAANMRLYHQISAQQHIVNAIYAITAINNTLEGGSEFKAKRL